MSSALLACLQNLFVAEVANGGLAGGLAGGDCEEQGRATGCDWIDLMR